MPVELVAEDDLRAALRPMRVNRERFVSGVRERLQNWPQEQHDTLFRLPPLLRGAAALLPVSAVTGSESSAVTSQLALVTGIYKMLGYLALPAISLFALVAASTASFASARGAAVGSTPSLTDVVAMRAALGDWWRQHKWGAIIGFVLTLVLALVGATWALYTMYIVSFVMLSFVLSSFARRGLANRQIIGPTCLTALMTLGQLAGMPTISDQGIYFIDPSVGAAILFCGVLAIFPLVVHKAPALNFPVEPTPRWVYAIVPAQVLMAFVVWLIVPNLWLTALLLGTAMLLWGTIAIRARQAGQSVTPRKQKFAMICAAVILIPLVAWQAWPLYWVATPARIKNYVESFHTAEYGALSWRNFATVASWTQDAGLNPNLSQARQLLERELAGKQDRGVLDVALQLGMLKRDEIGRLQDYARERKDLLDDPYGLVVARPISPSNEGWVIRAAALNNDLTSSERDFLAKRLRITLDSLSSETFQPLRTAAGATQLLQVIDRPLAPGEYQSQMHALLREYHTTRGGGFQPAGGFKAYSAATVGSLDDTADAVELMQLYGIPEGLDLNWVRSYLRPRHQGLGYLKWVAAVTLDRLNQLPGVQPPTWLDLIYYQRSLIAALMLVGVCWYATAVMPQPTISSDPSPSDSEESDPASSET